MLERFAGDSNVLKLLAATGAVAAAAPAAVGIGDLFLGDANGLNSGEIPMNALLTLGGAAGSLGGATLGALVGGAASPLAREYVRGIGESMMGVPSSLNRSAPSKGDPDYEDYVRRKYAMRQEMRGIARGMKLDNYREVPIEAGINRAMGRAGVGAVLGTMLGVTPSVLAMWDQGKAQPPQPPAAGAGVNQSLG